MLAFSVVKHPRLLRQRVAAWISNRQCKATDCSMCQVVPGWSASKWKMNLWNVGLPCCAKLSAISFSSVLQTLVHLRIEVLQAAHWQGTNICCSDCLHVVGISSQAVYFLGQPFNECSSYCSNYTLMLEFSWPTHITLNSNPRIGIGEMSQFQLMYGEWLT